MNTRFTLLYVTAGVLVGALWWFWVADSTNTSLKASEPGTVSGLWRTVSGLLSDSHESEAQSAAVVSYNSAVMRAAPAVVSVYASRAPEPASTATSAAQRVQTTQGSGVMVRADGIIVTNRHIVDQADTINVVLANGRLHPATMIGNDAETDIAVLRIPANDLPTLALDAGRELLVGDVVLAIGNPFGVGQTVTQGIVSATRRRVAKASPWQNFVQIDAAINPGNSGGALINPAGELVGVSAAVFRRPDGSTAGSPAASNSDHYAAAAQGIGFAIPATLLAEVVPEIVEHGRVARSWLGIEADDLPMFPRLARSLGTVAGAVITELAADGPAKRYGLQRGDVVTAVNDMDVATAYDLLLAISSNRPDSESLLTLFRDGSEREIAVILGERPSGKAATLARE